MESLKDEIAAAAARMVVEEGADYASAKRRAAKQLAAGQRTELPDNDALESAVREYIAVFCADTQPAELVALRELALVWMQRLATFRPHIAGAVWQGTATRLSDIHLQLFCDDCKSAELALIDHGVRYSVGSAAGLHGGEVTSLHLHSLCQPLGEQVGVHLAIYDHDDLRGALKADARGRAPRGDAAGLRKRMELEAV